jgi:hypothetical protein
MSYQQDVRVVLEHLSGDDPTRVLERQIRSVNGAVDRTVGDTPRGGGRDVESDQRSSKPHDRPWWSAPNNGPINGSSAISVGH